MNKNIKSVLILSLMLTIGCGDDNSLGPTLIETGKIAYMSNMDSENYQIFIMEPDGSEKRNISNNEHSDSQPDISPDGTKIVFATRENYNSYIAVMNIDGSDRYFVTDGDEADGHPAWLPDGMKIAFMSQTRNDGGLFVVNADGSGLIQIAGPSNYGPRWSPDGNKLIYTRTPGLGLGGSDIYQMNPDGTNEVLISDHEEEEAQPKWSPDGSRITFFRYREDDLGPPPIMQIYVMNADGTNQVNLSNNNYEYMDASPSWGVE